MNRTRTASLLAALTAATVLSLTACTGSSGDNDASSTSEVGGEAGVDALTASGGEVAPEAAAPDADTPEAARSAVDETADRADAASGAKARPPAMSRAVISKGNVELRADDVARARFDLGKVVDRFGGEVAEEDTQTDREGEVRFSRLVVRVPAESFTAAMDELKTVGTLVNDSRKSTDVTTQVIDTDVRVRAQKRSINRIQQLLSQAESIGDVVSIESQLAQREADLQSLQQQQAFLADETTLSTITVAIERTPEDREKKEAPEDDTGFLAGLDAGWSALATFAVGLATVLGALLPWLVLIGLLGVPALLLLRRLRRTAQPG